MSIEEKDLLSLKRDLDMRASQELEASSRREKARQERQDRLPDDLENLQKIIGTLFMPDFELINKVMANQNGALKLYHDTANTTIHLELEWDRAAIETNGGTRSSGKKINLCWETRFDPDKDMNFFAGGLFLMGGNGGNKHPRIYIDLKKPEWREDYKTKLLKMLAEPSSYTWTSWVSNYQRGENY